MSQTPIDSLWNCSQPQRNATTGALDWSGFWYCHLRGFLSSLSSLRSGHWSVGEARGAPPPSEKIGFETQECSTSFEKPTFLPILLQLLVTEPLVLKFEFQLSSSSGSCSKLWPFWSWLLDQEVLPCNELFRSKEKERKKWPRLLGWSNNVLVRHNTTLNWFHNLTRSWTKVIVKLHSSGAKFNFEFEDPSFNLG